MRTAKVIGFSAKSQKYRPRNRDCLPRDQIARRAKSARKCRGSLDLRAFKQGHALLKLLDLFFKQGRTFLHALEHVDLDIELIAGN